MGFSAPGFLPLVGLAAIPVIIHILSRLRLRRVPFPSLLLLRSVRKERFSWIRLKELLLLVLRTLLLLALLLALARPFLTRSIPGLGQAADIILVIDDSYSMTYADRWEQCLSDAKELVRSLGPDRKVVLLTASGQIPDGRVSGRGPVLALLDSLQPTFLAPELGPALKQATILAESLHASVTAITDLQDRAIPLDWHPPAGVSITLNDVGTRAFDNAGISRLYPEDPFAAAGRPVRIRADIVNHGEKEITRTAVLSLGGQREERVLKIPAQGRRTITFETTISKPGTHIGHLELRSDSLSTDDARHLALLLPEKTRILIVESDRVPGRYVKDALTADTTAQFQVELINVTEFSRRDPRNYQVVVITDASALKAPDLSRLDFHLRSGGAGLLMVGPVPTGTVNIGGYVQSLGFARPAGFVSVTRADTTHPILEKVGLSALSSVRIWQHSRLDPKENLVLARLADQDPLILESPAHRLIIWAIGPTPEFSDLVYKAAFVPLLHRTVSYLAQTRLRTDYFVGDTIRFRLDNLSTVVVKTPKGRIRLEPTIEHGQATLTLTQTLMPGIYAIESEGINGQPLAVAVNPLAEEGDLTQASYDRLVSQGLHVRSDKLPPSADLTIPLLYIAAAAFAAELLLLLF